MLRMSCTFYCVSEPEFSNNCLQTVYCSPVNGHARYAAHVVRKSGYLLLLELRLPEGGRFTGQLWLEAAVAQIV